MSTNKSTCIDKNNIEKIYEVINFYYPRVVCPRVKTQKKNESFAFSNFFFILNSTNELKADGFFISLDSFPKWHSALFVIGRSTHTNIPICPICLDENISCPRITMCGHVFCLLCIGRHISEPNTNGKPKISCPVCFKTVKDCDLRLFINQIDIENPKKFLLMKRRAKTIYIEPMNSSYILPPLSTHQKFQYYTNKHIKILIDLYQKEMDFLLKQLELAYNSDVNDYDFQLLPYIEKYMAFIGMKLEALNTHLYKDNKLIIEERLEYSKKYWMDDISSIPGMKSNKQISMDHDNGSLFFQAEDGSSVYLDFLTTESIIKLVKDECIIELDDLYFKELIMDQKIRKDKLTNHLLHLPIGCQFILCGFP